MIRMRHKTVGIGTYVAVEGGRGEDVAILALRLDGLRALGADVLDDLPDGGLASLVDGTDGVFDGEHGSRSAQACAAVDDDWWRRRAVTGLKCEER